MPQIKKCVRIFCLVRSGLLCCKGVACKDFEYRVAYTSWKPTTICKWNKDKSITIYHHTSPFMYTCICAVQMLCKSTAKQSCPGLCTGLWTSKLSDVACSASLNACDHQNRSCISRVPFPNCSRQNLSRQIFFCCVMMSSSFRPFGNHAGFQHQQDVQQKYTQRVIASHTTTNTDELL